MPEETTSQHHASVIAEGWGSVKAAYDRRGRWPDGLTVNEVRRAIETASESEGLSPNGVYADTLSPVLNMLADDGRWPEAMVKERYVGPNWLVPFALGAFRVAVWGWVVRRIRRF